MNIEIDFRSGIPIYLQMVERIKERIATGRLTPGDQLPTVRSLALELRVNFNTVARAYRILDEVGIISTQQGRGTYVMNNPPPEISEKIRQKALKALTHRYLADAERLGASSEELNQILKDQVTHWQQAGHLLDPELDNE
ncbi:MAG: GntR family transcriptional regulator [Chloroflexi bacterium]|jgi:GntR family transcriptional regulator|nr:GntR family transcriptional regulator [Chloroflexota bacterium]